MKRESHLQAVVKDGLLPAWSSWDEGQAQRHAIPLGLNQMQTWLGAWAFELWYLGDKDDVQNRLSPCYGDCFTRLMRGVGWARFNCYGLHITCWYWGLEN